jgi:peroxiredoxin
MSRKESLKWKLQDSVNHCTLQLYDCMRDVGFKFQDVYKRHEFLQQTEINSKSGNVVLIWKLKDVVCEVKVKFNNLMKTIDDNFKDLLNIITEKCKEKLRCNSEGHGNSEMKKVLCCKLKHAEKVIIDIVKLVQEKVGCLCKTLDKVLSRCVRNIQGFNNECKVESVILKIGDTVKDIDFAINDLRKDLQLKFQDSEKEISCQFMDN